MASRSARLLALAALLGCGACLSPTLPLPPPEPSDITASSTKPGVWIVVGKCNVGGDTILVKNEKTGLGRSAFCGDAQKYSIEIEATLCDQGTVAELDEKNNELAKSDMFFFEPTTSGFQSGCK